MVSSTGEGRRESIKEQEENRENIVEGKGRENIQV
jgi:hypothetical protein